jgi:hypothetical protein
MEENRYGFSAQTKKDRLPMVFNIHQCLDPNRPGPEPGDSDSRTMGLQEMSPFVRGSNLSRSIFRKPLFSVRLRVILGTFLRMNFQTM